MARNLHTNLAQMCPPGTLRFVPFGGVHEGCALQALGAGQG